MAEEEKKKGKEGKEIERADEKEKKISKRPSEWIADPFKEMDRMLEDLDRTFGDFFGRPLLRRRMEDLGRPDFRTPVIDFQDKEDHFLVEAEIPGIDKEDIEVEVKEDKLTISAEKEEEVKEEGEDYIRQERGYHSFYRELPMPDNVLTDEVEASLENGILNIQLPKKEPEKKKGKTIEIK